MAKQAIVVFGGGNALGANLAGAYERMLHQQVRPDWIIGASARAITGAIVVGNPPERRPERHASSGPRRRQAPISAADGLFTGPVDLGLQLAQAA